MRVILCYPSLPPPPTFGIGRLLSPPSYKTRKMGCTRGQGRVGARGTELSTSNIEESNTRGGQNGRDSCIQLRIHFFRESFKGGNCSTTSQNPNCLLANKFRRKTYFTTSVWLSGYPTCHLLGHAPSIKTASRTHIFADMNVVKDFISTSKNFHLRQ